MKKKGPDYRLLLGRTLLDQAGTGQPLQDWQKQFLKELLGPHRSAKARLWARWRAVRAAKRGLKWDQAYQAASDALAGTAHAGRPREMKRAYQAGQKIARKWLWVRRADGQLVDVTTLGPSKRA